MAPTRTLSVAAAALPLLCALSASAVSAIWVGGFYRPIGFPFYPALYGVNPGYGTSTVIVTGRKLAQADASCKSVAELLAATPNLSQLARLSGALDPQLKGELSSKQGSAFTLFAPSDDALRQLLASLPDAQSAAPELVRNSTALSTLIAYHLVPGAGLTAAQLRDGQELKTALPTVPPLKVRKEGGNVMIQAVGSQAAVKQADIKACRGGIVHIIDTVLLPVPTGAMAGAAAVAPARG